ncbi:MAG: MFS transporter [Methylococcaceae bacterium]|nr:MAG: MFS transporter [Methylococcaceae bacterium]
MMQPAIQPTSSEHALFSKISRRLLPFLLLLFVVAYLDRVNIGFARLQMNADLGFGDTVYGIGAGLFFIGYFLFEVPSNLILHRVGARRWIARIIALWGLISAAMVWVKTPQSFYALRFLLGLGEAGFFPGIIYYLTQWYPAARRAQTVAWFLIGVPIAGLLGGPISGWLMAGMDGVLELRGWQWLFVLEGLPAVLLGLLCLWWLDDGPATANWLTPEEKSMLAARLRDAGTGATGTVLHTFADALAAPRVWGLAHTITHNLSITA